jgi:hypothetical protein
VTRARGRFAEAVRAVLYFFFTWVCVWVCASTGDTATAATAISAAPKTAA